jgi:hypothetical protein
MTSWEDTGGGDNCVPHDRHVCAFSGFSTPHFEQYIVFSLRLKK